MVSVNEKYFIEKVAGEINEKCLESPRKFVNSKVSYSSDDSWNYQTSDDSNGKCLSPRKFVNNKVSYSSDDSWNYQRSDDSEGFKFDNLDDSWDHNYVDNRTKGKYEHPLSSSDVSLTPRKKIAWGNQVIDNINNILSKSYLNSPSCSSKQKMFNVHKFHDDFNGRVEHNKSGDNGSWDDSPYSQSCERNSHYTYKMSRKRNHSRFDDQETFKQSKRKNYSIQPLDANWKYENIEYEEILNEVKERTAEIEDWVRKNQPKISLLGDSHGRYLADILTEMLPGFKIEASVKPGAKSKRVLLSFKDVLQDMSENDFIVTLSGTNDMWSESLGEPKSVVYNKVMEVKCTNVLLCNIPRNYMEPYDCTVQDNIINFNQFYQDVVSFSKRAHLVDLHRLKDKKFFTRHGLHFNLYGKIKICDLVSNKILDIVDSIKR